MKLLKTNNIKLTIEYNGLPYSGWQSQKNEKTIQSEIEKAIFKFSGHQTVIQGAGRTDAGVHALGQCANFFIDKKYSEYQIVNGLNFHLGSEKIRIVSAQIVEEKFDSRFSAKIKTYRYQIVNRTSPSVLLSDFSLHIRPELNIDIMQEAIMKLIGKYDFSSFRARDCQAKNPIRTLEDAEIKRNNQIIHISFSAKSFLYQQIRIMAGTLIEVGLNKIKPQDIPKIIDSRNRSLAGPTAPARGLTLVKIEY